MQTLRRIVALPVLIGVTTFTVACDDDDITDPRADVIGDFTATEAVFTESADATNSFDVIAEGGEFDLRFREDGDFTSTLTLPNRDPVVRTGTFDVAGSNILFTEDGATRTVPFERTTTGIAFSDPNDRFDFEGAGTRAAARLDVSLRRQ